MEEDKVEKRVCNVEFYFEHVAVTRGELEKEWLSASVDAFWELNSGEYEYVDNTRLADNDVSEETLTYEIVASTGCCGSFDCEFAGSPCGRTYLYGFNYGH